MTLHPKQCGVSDFSLHLTWLQFHLSDLVNIFHLTTNCEEAATNTGTVGGFVNTGKWEIIFYHRIFPPLSHQTDRKINDTLSASKGKPTRKELKWYNAINFHSAKLSIHDAERLQSRDSIGLTDDNNHNIQTMWPSFISNHYKWSFIIPVPRTDLFPFSI